MKKFNLLINNIPSCEAITSGEFNSKEEAELHFAKVKQLPLIEFLKIFNVNEKSTRTT
jgi:hypothetical protein